MRLHFLSHVNLVMVSMMMPQINDAQQDYSHNDDVHNDVSYAQTNGIWVQESLRRSMRVSEQSRKFAY